MTKANLDFAIADLLEAGACAVAWHRWFPAGRLAFSFNGQVMLTDGNQRHPAAAQQDQAQMINAAGRLGAA